ncbi:shiftless antiviral inhibitor of ribosomal frameshifting protein homolog [Salvelinus sp. IW2-2015]|uniref:shiftless antiviral inhibitor of ribosomal frameshifting protein homolog n=1 Tax=Salvelinus sp. IW2-2015 TaxID=2691554 RepID=UPI0038D39748
MCPIFYLIYNMIECILFILDYYCPFLICLLTQLEKSVRRFRETFHGKIAVEKATLLMRRYANNHQMVTWAVILKKGNELDDEDRKCLETDQAVKNVVQRLTAEDREPLVPPAQQHRGSRQPEDDNDIKELGERLRVLPLTEKNKRMFDNAQRHLTPSVLHQFACQTCDKDWWRRVPQRKRVSRCHLCKEEYDPCPFMTKCGVLEEFCCTKCTRSSEALGGWIWAPPATPVELW